MRTLLLVGALAAVGVMAHAATKSDGEEATPQAPATPPTVRRASVRPAPALPALAAGDVADEPADVTAEESDLEDLADPETEEDGGEDVGTMLAALQERARLEARTHNAIVGSTRDEATGEPLVGVTIAATSPGMPGSQVAISDEEGTYELTALPAGFYTLTFYYGDVALERSNIVVSSTHATHIDQAIDTVYRARDEWARYVEEPEPEIALEPEYIKTIPVPGRTFEAALGAAVDAQGDDDHEPIRTGARRRVHEIVVPVKIERMEPDDQTTVVD